MVNLSVFFWMERYWRRLLLALQRASLFVLFPLTIGTDIYDPSPVYLNGTLDEIRVYDVALSNGEIQDLFDEFLVSTSTVDKADISFSIRPNPSSDYIYIDSSFEVNKMSVFDTQGRFVKELFADDANKFAVHSLSQGIYIVKFIHKKSTYSKQIYITDN